MEPIITIGMPVFNDVDFIEASLLSVLNQTRKDFVLILSDDGATDGSTEICLKYAALDNRIVFHRQTKNIGISKNMEFLLHQAKTPYFMWAGDDDLIHPDFIAKHIQHLEEHPNAIVSFSEYAIIDEVDAIQKVHAIHYGSPFRFFQLLKLVYFENDGFGYGVFVREKIKNVTFPIWWWPNKNTPYNNIYPSLCFYLNRGRYIHLNELLFEKREKSGRKINHKISGAGNGYKELVSFFIRRFYLVHYSFLQVLKSPTFYNAFLIYPFMLVKWFFYSSFAMLYSSLKSKLHHPN